MFEMPTVPALIFGAGQITHLAGHMKSLGLFQRPLLVVDPYLVQAGIAQESVTTLAESGVHATVFHDFAGEPKSSHIAAAAQMAQSISADLIIGIGGGSALDIAKTAASCALHDTDPMVYALGKTMLPKSALPKIMIPTTSGTGSETSATNIFSDPDGHKVWIWGPQTKADLVILDPQLTQSLPASLTAWCGMDALVHAFEAATNRNTHPGAHLYAHSAIKLILPALPDAIQDPENLNHRGALCLGAAYAGVAIDACGTAIAHAISHGLAGLRPIHHGLATAIAFEASLPWLVETPTPELQEMTSLLGVDDPSDIPGQISDLMRRCAIAPQLPDSFAEVTAKALSMEMCQPGNMPMIRSTARDVTDADVLSLAGAVLRRAE